MDKKKFCILSDSSIRVDSLIREIPDLYIFPFKIIIKNKEYVDDGKEITSKEIYDFQKDDFLKTSQPSMFEFENMANDLLKRYEKIYFFSLGKTFSGLITNLKLVIQTKFKDKVFLINTENIYLGTLYAIKNALPLLKARKSLNEIQKATDEFIKNSCYFFVLSDNSYLAKSGRINKITFLLTNVLKIKVIFKYNDKTTSIVEKIRTISTAWDKLIVLAKEFGNNIDNPVYNFIHSSVDIEHVQKSFDKLKSIINGNEHVNGPFELTTSLACHIGPEIFGIFINPAIK